jgi:biotin carboxyl carrier protein
MTLYRVTVGSHEYQITVSDKALSVNGEQIQANLIPLNEVGAYLLRLGNRKRELQVSAQERGAYSVTSRGRKIIARVEKGFGRLRSQINPDCSNIITAPMPGMVVEILVKEGDAVEVGQSLVVLESMKMQMEMRAPISGRVEKVHVPPKSQVDKSAVLVTIRSE